MECFGLMDKQQQQQHILHQTCSLSLSNTSALTELDESLLAQHVIIYFIFSPHFCILFYALYYVLLAGEEPGQSLESDMAA